MNARVCLCVSAMGVEMEGKEGRRRVVCESGVVLRWIEVWLGGV